MVKREKGFTLIEVIAVLLLMGLMVVFAGQGIIVGVRGYLLARENAGVAQKAQVALSRMIREFQECGDCVTESPPTDLIVTDSDTFVFHNAVAESASASREIAWTGEEITLNGDVLVDQVQAFVLRYQADNRIAMELTMAYGTTDAAVTFTTAVMPRNTY